MYKVLNDQSAPHFLRASITKLNDTNINYNLSRLETDLALPRPKTNFLKRSFKHSQHSGAMPWNNLSYQAKTVQSLSEFKSKFASLPSAGSL